VQTRPWLCLAVLLVSACSASAESAPPPMDPGTYQVRLKDLEARVAALKEQLGRRHAGPCVLLLPEDAGVDETDADAAP
jgi:hypothetical protein